MDWFDVNFTNGCGRRGGVLPNINLMGFHAQVV
jgi:hypothetical protein